MLNRTVGQRSRTLVMTSPSARACGAHISPMEFRQRQLAVRVEQALALELHAQLVDLLLQSAAGADLADVVADEAQPRLLDPDVGLAMHDHAVALLE